MISSLVYSTLCESLWEKDQRHEMNQPDSHKSRAHNACYSSVVGTFCLLQVKTDPFRLPYPLTPSHHVCSKCFSGKQTSFSSLSNWFVLILNLIHRFPEAPIPKENLHLFQHKLIPMKEQKVCSCVSLKTQKT